MRVSYAATVMQCSGRERIAPSSMSAATIGVTTESIVRRSQCQEMLWRAICIAAHCWDEKIPPGQEPRARSV